MIDQHPRPWRVDKHENAGWILDADGKVVIGQWFGPALVPTAELTADLIVAAVNAYSPWVRTTDRGPSPCPFCGSGRVHLEETESTHTYNKTFYHYACDKCGGRTAYKDTEALAIEDWNKRGVAPDSPWVSVEDQLPEVGVFVIAWHPLWRRSRIVRFGEPIPEQWDLELQGEWKDPTHWMPPPAPPST
jgi:Lar family restriction alleviation protein